MIQPARKVPRVTVDIEKRELQFDDLGCSIRRLMGAAAADYSQHRIRKWKLIYKGCPVGSLQLRSESHERVNS